MKSTASEPGLSDKKEVATIHAFTTCYSLGQTFIKM